MVYLLSQTVDLSAKKFPQHEAFTSGKRALTYEELALKTDQLAHYLVQEGVKKGDRIGIYLNRCLEAAIAVHGIMKAGAVYVPLDTSAPATRTKYLLEDCEISLMITNPVHRMTLGEVIKENGSLKTLIGFKEDGEIKYIDWDEIFQVSVPDNWSVNILEDDLAYIMYTSGSTGLPKGIMHTHRSGLSYAKLSADLYKINHEDRIGNHSPLHFDISTLGFFTGPLVGATTVIVPEAYTKMPASLSGLMEQEKMTVWYSVPLALTQMLQKGFLADRDMSSLRWILFAGEIFIPKHLSSIMKLLPECRFSNIYGPAEVNQCTYYNLDTPPRNDSPVPLGQIWRNTEALIIDEHDQEVNNGEVGELLVRSATMMKGYWKQPALTKKSMLSVENTPGVFNTFYRTGDLVKINAKGHLMFLGRKDRQVKVRGYRVELDEIAHVLLGYKEVEEAAIFTTKKDEVISIEAAIILKVAMTLTDIEIIEYLKKNLPKYAVPDKVIITNAFPRTSTGKIDHRQLSKDALNRTK